MWTAISNPLLLISHVLRRSMDLQQSSGANDEMSGTAECDGQEQMGDDDLDAESLAHNMSACCEYVSVERHAEPTPANADWQNQQAIDDNPFIPTSSVSSSR
jgi:hypothetical protein